MSSSTRLRPDRRLVRIITVMLVILAVQPLAGARAAATSTGTATLPLPDVAVLSAAEPRVTLVVNVGGSTQPESPESVSVTVGGVRQPTTVVPVVSDQLGVAIVVDTSDAGA